jgi:hypothetical protein
MFSGSSQPVLVITGLRTTALSSTFHFLAILMTPTFTQGDGLSHQDSWSGVWHWHNQGANEAIHGVNSADRDGSCHSSFHTVDVSAAC